MVVTGMRITTSKTLIVLADPVVRAMMANRKIIVVLIPEAKTITVVMTKMVMDCQRGILD